MGINKPRGHNGPTEIDGLVSGHRHRGFHEVYYPRVMHQEIAWPRLRRRTIPHSAIGDPQVNLRIQRIITPREPTHACHAIVRGCLGHVYR